ncbi:MAG TPA: GTPase ObgE [Pirellulales bacterium]|jgi:GTP-binding protein|nr:GTPase ObgE [Pirellulales bacterium]
MFVDRVQIEIRAGRGGDGCSSFRREKYVPRGGPDGGDGGHGGSVIIVASAGVDSLAELSQRRHWKAPAGERGGSSNCHGHNAADLVIHVPPGTVVMDAVAGHVLKDLSTAGEQVVAGRGGRGGKGNVRFKSATNRAPRQCTPGGEGEVRLLVLELKVIADVGLIGKPNAGKSTLLSRLSRARPEIADYPFTTKYPNLGIVQISRDRSFVMADIPGLIEGAHDGAGLGHEFLRHVQRAGILVHMVEPSPVDGSDPIENYEVVRNELDQYDPTLRERVEIVVVTKAELPGAQEVRERLAQRIAADESAEHADRAEISPAGDRVLAVSAVTGQGLDRLLAAITRALDEHQSAADPAAADHPGEQNVSGLPK